MSYSEMALGIAKKAHKGQKDKAGVDYINHPIYVASLLETDEQKAVAYLHDVIEDTNITIDDLKSYGFPKHIVEAVEAITKKELESYDDYLKRVANNSLAKIVKIADLIHNSDLTRLKSITQEDINRKIKYQKSIIKLSEKVGG